MDDQEKVSRALDRVTHAYRTLANTMAASPASKSAARAAAVALYKHAVLAESLIDEEHRYALRVRWRKAVAREYLIHEFISPGLANAVQRVIDRRNNDDGI